MPNQTKTVERNRRLQAVKVASKPVTLNRRLTCVQRLLLFMMDLPKGGTFIKPQLLLELNKIAESYNEAPDVRSTMLDREIDRQISIGHVERIGLDKRGYDILRITPCGNKRLEFARKDLETANHLASDSTRKNRCRKYLKAEILADHLSIAGKKYLGHVSQEQAAALNKCEAMEIDRDVSQQEIDRLRDEVKHLKDIIKRKCQAIQEIRTSFLRAAYDGW
ncbi:hypothetical protein BD410DRAFT_791378 [Rickenella mellea]|uniref:Uncharacterized protein n=1 Tax=Rickenella mellea TaxID=50990 RepID=A0A4Y7PZN8_9AGAM|nr:hypothetical protein BD410DRAFT_791378 [Rickenella mellea]